MGVGGQFRPARHCWREAPVKQKDAPNLEAAFSAVQVEPLERSRLPLASNEPFPLFCPTYQTGTRDALTLFGRRSCAATEQKISIQLTLLAGDAAANSRPSWHLEAGRGAPGRGAALSKRRIFLMLSFPSSTQAAAAAARRRADKAPTF